MKKVSREDYVKQSLNDHMWSRYLVDHRHDQCPLIVKHHNGFDEEDLTTNLHGLNLGLLKKLRDALQTVTPGEFEHFFSIHQSYPRVVHQPGKLFRTLETANDQALSAMAPIFGGCLFRLTQQDRIIDYLNFHQSDTRPLNRPGPFASFIRLYLLSAWYHAKKTPVLTAALYGLKAELVEVLNVSELEKILQLSDSEMPLQFLFGMNENLILSAPTFPQDPMLKLMQVTSLLSHAIESQVLGFKAENREATKIFKTAASRMKLNDDPLFKQTQRLRDELEKDEAMDWETVEEFVAEQLLILGIRSEFLTVALSLSMTRLKNIQRKLERKGHLTGVIHRKRTLEPFDNSAKKYLLKGRIAVGVFLRFYEMLKHDGFKQKIDLFAFTVAFVVTNEIFEHSLMSLSDIAPLAADLAFFFCFEWECERVEPIFCSHCGQIYTTFTLETSDLLLVHCPFCQRLKARHLATLRKALHTGFGL